MNTFNIWLVVVANVLALIVTVLDLLRHYAG